ncbi:oligosaccharide flippase family protein [Phenylobacterium sp.]|uniref:lipopolysaccharide biosynthesis protein n=1 Tax=Phenylobacterium sp. TaxID=1871053 RepID=UPI0028126F15|nr:oligosaccharide flippase family protein [Phenylobacterium sp.]
MFAVLAWSGPALLGVYGVLTSIELVAIYLAGFEFHTFTTRRYARRPSPRALGRSLACHRKMLLVSTPLAVIGAGLAAWLLGLNLGWVEYLSFLIVVATGVAVQETVRFIVLIHRPVMSVVVSFIRTASWQPAALLCLSAPSPLLPMLALWAVAALMSLVLAAWLLRAALWRRVRIPLRYLAHGLLKGRNYYLTANAAVLQGNLERFVLQTFLGPAAVGVYAFFQSLASTLPALVQSAVLNLWLPSLLKDFGQRRSGRFTTLRRAALRALAVSALLSVGVAVGAAALSLLSGHREYIPLLWMLGVLLVGQIVQVWTQPVHLALYAAHRDRALMILSLTVLAASSVLGILLVRSAGVQGAVMSQLAGGLMLGLARSGLFRFYLKRNVI